MPDGNFSSEEGVCFAILSHPKDIPVLSRNTLTDTDDNFVVLPRFLSDMHEKNGFLTRKSLPANSFLKNFSQVSFICRIFLLSVLLRIIVSYLLYKVNEMCTYKDCHTEIILWKMIIFVVIFRFLCCRLRFKELYCNNRRNPLT